MGEMSRPNLQPISRIQLVGAAGFGRLRREAEMKKFGLSLLAGVAFLIFAGASQANAAVRFGFGVGVAPPYGYPPPAYYSSPYYPYAYSPYAPYYDYGYDYPYYYGYTGPSFYFGGHGHDYGHWGGHYAYRGGHGGFHGHEGHEGGHGHGGHHH